jgi:hypothetical protein
MAKTISTSFELTSITAPVLDKLRLAGWDIKEVVNAGIIMFSQADEKQQQFFRSIAVGLDIEQNENARDIFRKWIVELVADAQVYNKEKTRVQKSQTKSVEPTPDTKGQNDSFEDKVPEILKELKTHATKNKVDPGQNALKSG